MRYHEAACGDLAALPLAKFSYRFELFQKVHKDDIKLRAAMMGVKM